MVDGILVDDDSVSNNTDGLSQLEKDIQAANLARNTKVKGSKEVKVETSSDEAEETDLPEKYRGKSKREVIEMHRNLESSHGRMANDLGTQRHLTDVLLGLKRDRDLQANGGEKPVTGDELLADPAKAIERTIAPREKAQHERIDNIEQQLRIQAFASQHPDYQSYVGNAEFDSWIRSSPIRVRAAASAAGGDWSSAGDLLTEFKAHKAAGSKKVDDEVDEEPEDNLKAARKVQLESSSQSASSGGKKVGKLYKRAEIMKLRLKKPDVYYSDEFQQEIVRAYAEGRVK
jgi:hypothetical protein